MLKRIQVCMGSACHLKGAPLVAHAIQAELDKRAAAGEVVFELYGAFCQNQCTEGVLVKIDGVPFTHVTVADVPGLLDRFWQEV